MFQSVLQFRYRLIFKNILFIARNYFETSGVAPARSQTSQPNLGSISLITSYIKLLSFIKECIVFTSYRSLINLCGALQALTALDATRLRSSAVKYLDSPLS